MTTNTTKKEYDLDKGLERMKSSTWESIGAIKTMIYLVGYGIGMWGLFTVASGFAGENYLKELLGWVKMAIGGVVLYSSTKVKVNYDD